MSGKIPCIVYQEGIGRNPIRYPCANVGSTQNAAASKGNLVSTQFHSNEVTDNSNLDKVMLAVCSLQVVDRFCYLGDVLDAGGGAESCTIIRVRSVWKKFRELVLTTK